MLKLSKRYMVHPIKIYVVGVHFIYYLMIYYMHLNITSTLSHTSPMLVYYLLFVNEGALTRTEKVTYERPHTW